MKITATPQRGSKRCRGLAWAARIPCRKMCSGQMQISLESTVHGKSWVASNIGATCTPEMWFIKPGLMWPTLANRGNWSKWKLSRKRRSKPQPDSRSENDPCRESVVSVIPPLPGREGVLTCLLVAVSIVLAVSSGARFGVKFSRLPNPIRYFCLQHGSPKSTIHGLNGSASHHGIQE